MSIDQASRLLATALATIPPIISVSFDPAASENHLLAVVRDIREKKERAVRHAGSAGGQQRVKTRQTALQRAVAPVRSMRRIPTMGRRGSGTSTTQITSPVPEEISTKARQSHAVDVPESSVPEEISTTVSRFHAVV